MAWLTWWACTQPFFRALHYRMLQNVCCRFMTLRRCEAEEHLFCIDDEGHEYFVTMQGSVRVLIRGNDERGKAAGYGRDDATEPAQPAQKKKEIVLREGSSFGEIALTSTNPADRRRTAGIQSREPSMFGVLSREHYLDATSTIEGQVFNALETPSGSRTRAQLDLMMEFFRERPACAVVATPSISPRQPPPHRALFPPSLLLGSRATNSVTWPVPRAVFVDRVQERSRFSSSCCWRG
eukprot:SAG25_NODE_37_length_19691_cov_19.319467_25_plen_238_part_00